MVDQKKMRRRIGNRKWRPVLEFDQQFHDGREHITCPRCHATLGRIEQKPATTWDWIKYIYNFTLEDFTWKGRLLTSLIVTFVAMGTLVCGGVNSLNIPLIDYLLNWIRIRTFFGLGLGLFVMVWIWMNPANSWNYHPGRWWWYNGRPW